MGHRPPTSLGSLFQEIQSLVHNIKPSSKTVYGLILRIIPSSNLLLKNNKTIAFLLLSSCLLVTKLENHAYVECLDKQKVFYEHSFHKKT